MAICPFAKQLPLGWNAPAILPTQIILHSAVTPPGYDLFSQWKGNGENGVACHFYVRGDGSIEQYLPTDRQANAQYAGNAHGISIESEGLDPDNNPWNSDELLAIERLLNWCHVTHGIPLERCASETSTGVGWHSMWGCPDSKPNGWNWDAHTCPGAARIAQIPSLLHPPVEVLVVASTTNRDGRAETFRLDSAGAITHRWQTKPGGPWSAWTALASVASGQSLTATCDGTGRLNLFVDTPAGVVQAFQTVAGGGWSPFAKF